MLERAAKPLGVGARNHHVSIPEIRRSTWRCALCTPLQEITAFNAKRFNSAIFAGSSNSSSRALPNATSKPSSVSTKPKPRYARRSSLCQPASTLFLRTIHSVSESQTHESRSLPRRSVVETTQHNAASENLRNLQELIRNFKTSKGRGEAGATAWDLFATLSPDERTPPLIQALIPLLASSSNDIANQIVPLFEALDVRDREPSVYPIVIQRLLNTGRTGKAIAIVESAINARKSPLAVSANDVLKHLVSHHQWQLLFRLFRQCVQSFGSSALAQDWCHNFFHKVKWLPHYTSHVLSLIKTLRDFPNAISPEADPVFVNMAVEHVFFLAKPGFGSLHQTDEVLSTLADMRVLNQKTFDSAIWNCLTKFRKDPPSKRLQTAFNIYQRGWQCKSFPHGPDLAKKPDEDILYCLLYEAALAANVAVIKTVHEDRRIHYGVPTRKTTKLLVRGYAKAGDLDSASKAFHEFFSVAHGHDDHDFMLDQEVLSTMLHAYAVRGNPEAIISLMDFVEREKGLKPNDVCWTCLLNAYSKNGDLGGAMQAYSNMISAGYEPSRHTYGILMQLGAESGDVALVQDLLESASQHWKRPDAYLYNPLVLALVNTKQWAKARNFAVSVTPNLPPSESTYIFNTLLRHISRPHPAATVASIQKMMRIMQEHNVPLNSYSTSVLMRAYCKAKQTHLAEELLFQRPSAKGHQVTAFHYGIVMDGYADQGQFSKGLSIHARMHQNGIKPNISSNIALIKLHGLAAKQRATQDKVNRPLIRLDLSQELLNELVEGSETEIFRSKEPTLRSSHYGKVNSYPAAYFDFLITLYAKHGAHDMVEALIEQLHRKLSEIQGTTDIRIPFRTLGLIMTHNYRKLNHKQVDEYWEKIMDFAVRMTTTSQKLLTQRAETKSISQSITSGPTSVIPKHKKMLNRPFDVYMRSLAARGLVPEIQRKIDEILRHGFELDNTNWNNYVNILMRDELYEEAFIITEKHLISLFQEQYKRRKASREGEVDSNINSEEQSLRDFHKPRVQYRTMLLLANKVQELRAGFHFDKNLAKGQLLDRLHEVAPRTMQATKSLRKRAYGKPKVQLVEQEIKPFSIRNEYGRKISLNSRKRRALRALWMEASPSAEEDDKSAQLLQLEHTSQIKDAPLEEEPPPHVSTVFMSVFQRSPLNRAFSLPPDFWQGS